MKDLRHLPTSTPTEDRDNNSKVNTPSKRNVDPATIENNSKVDAQLVTDFYRLVDASKGIIRGGRGANYSLAHPLARKDMPTDAYHLGKSVGKVKKT